MGGMQFADPKRALENPMDFKNNLPVHSAPTTYEKPVAQVKHEPAKPKNLRIKKPTGSGVGTQTGGD